jgi:hypothetical protein
MHRTLARSMEMCTDTVSQSMGFQTTDRTALDSRPSRYVLL